VVAGDTVVITVSDTGIGISAAALPHIFDAFVQESHAVGYNGAGLGIGLSVVRELIGAQGGTVVATSAGIGLGSQFVVSLPRSRGGE
jgi:diguanylate cyclase